MKIKNILTIIIIIVSGIACFALPPAAQADCAKGCFTNANTVFGDNALSSYVGFSNTAIGTEALESNTAGSYNVAIGVGTLSWATNGSNNVAIGYQALLIGDDNNGNTAHDNTATGY